MIILGLNIGHDSSAALLNDGFLLAACEEERYNKKKHTRAFPINAVNDCLKIAKLNISKVDIISVGFDPKKYIKEFILKPALDDHQLVKRIIDKKEKLTLYFNLEKIIRQKLKFKKRIEFNDHHMCHLASTYYPSNFKKSIVISYDGMGEIATGYFAKANKGRIKVFHKKNLFPNSLGLLYAAITSYLGWKANCDEGIIMGLASYGKPKNKIKGFNKTYIEAFRDIIKHKSGLDYVINQNFITYHKERDTWISAKFIKLFGKRKKYNDKITQNHKNIAAALQLRLEEIVLSQLKYIKKKNPDYEHLCLAGGVALNCSLNGKIAQSKIFKKIFIQPASGDSGLAIGSTIVSFIKYKNYKNLNFSKHSYLGSSFNDREILKVLQTYKNKIKFVKQKDIFSKTASLISDGKIIGWFQGSAEFGPRALGNRSILCKPFPGEMRDYINKKVKFREEFRPFAPAVLEENQKDYFEINQESPYMLIACKIKKEVKKKVQAIVHVDDTCRVQTVNEKYNKKFYFLIKKFFEKTDIPVLLNTSFNIKGQPIVNSPSDAIECFLKYKIDHLVINDFIIEKKFFLMKN